MLAQSTEKKKNLPPKRKLSYLYGLTSDALTVVVVVVILVNEVFEFIGAHLNLTRYDVGVGHLCVTVCARTGGGKNVCCCAARKPTDDRPVKKAGIRCSHVGLCCYLGDTHMDNELRFAIKELCWQGQS